MNNISLYCREGRGVMDVDEALALSVERLGFKDLKAEQREVVKGFVSGNDVFALPTWSGKSLCFALLPLVFDMLRGKSTPSIVVCISPLVALMTDQKAKFSPRGLVTEFVGGHQEDPEAYQSVIKGKCQLVYMAIFIWVSVAACG